MNSGGHFNFAQAALVVAGGAEVYGRKVDYVHQLTLGFFEQLNQKAKKKKDCKHFSTKISNSSCFSYLNR